MVVLTFIQPEHHFDERVERFRLLALEVIFYHKGETVGSELRGLLRQEIVDAATFVGGFFRYESPLIRRLIEFFEFDRHAAGWQALRYVEDVAG